MGSASTYSFNGFDRHCSSLARTELRFSNFVDIQRPRESPSVTGITGAYADVVDRGF